MSEVKCPDIKCRDNRITKKGFLGTIAIIVVLAGSLMGLTYNVYSQREKKQEADIDKGIVVQMETARQLGAVASDIEHLQETQKELKDQVKGVIELNREILHEVKKLNGECTDRKNEYPY